MKSNNTIEINGSLYDAKTGVPLKKSTEVASVTKSKNSSPRSVDGFRSNNKTKSLIKKPASINIDVKSETPAKKLERTLRNQAPKASNKPKQSSTLHRSAVKKPVISASKKSAPKQTVKSTALTHFNNPRHERAQQIPKSSVITRFNHLSSTLNTDIAMNESEPNQTLTHHLANTHLVSHENKKSENSKKELLIKQAVDKAMVDHKSKSSSIKSNRHITRYASTVAVALLLTGYVAYLNVPGISMKVAANQAGFAASLPGYTPGGYSLKTPINSSPGQVSIDFQANTDDRNFTLKQQPTTWDSVALLENFVTKNSQNYLTYRDRGLTIYIYDGSSAAWVSGGKMYNLEGRNAQLDTDQLLKLAASM